MTNLYVSDATRKALGIPSGAKRKTPRQLLGMEEDPEGEKLQDAARAALTRGMTAGVGTDLVAGRAQALQKAGTLGFDRAGLERELVGETDREAQLQRERLARQFAIDAGGAQSGTSQRAFETLESGVLGAKAGIRTQLRQQEAEQQRANLASLSATVGQFGQQDLAQVAQRLAAAQAAGQQLSVEEQNLVNAYNAVAQQGVAEQGAELARTQVMGKDVAGTATEQRRATEAQEALRGGELLGKYQGTQTLGAEIQRGGLAEQTRAAQAQESLAGGALTGTYNKEETIESRRLAVEKLNAAVQRAAAAGEQTGSYIDPDTKKPITTLQSQLQTAQIALQEAGVTGKYQDKQTVAGLNAALQRALQQGEATGTYEDPVSGKSYTTLQAEIQRGQLLEQTAARTDQTKLAAGALTGTYDNTQTIEALNAAVQRATQQGQATGTYIDPVTNKSLTTLQAEIQRGQLAEQITARGEQTALSAGELTGTYKETATVTALNAAIQRATQQGQATGVYTDPQTKSNIQTLQAQLQQEQIKAQRAEQTGTYGGGTVTAADLGVDVAGFTDNKKVGREAKFFELENALRQRGLLEGKSSEELSQMLLTLLGGQAVAIGGVDTLAAKQQTFQQGIVGREMTEAEAMGGAQRGQLTAQQGIAGRAMTETEAMGLAQRTQAAAATAQAQQRIGLERAALTGQAPVTAQDLGIDLTSYRDQKGVLTTPGVNAVNQAFYARFGRIPTQEELGPLLAGQGVVVKDEGLTLAAKQQVSQQGIAGRGMTLEEDIQKGQLTLAQQQEAARQREAEAGLTGEVTKEISPEQLGIPVATFKDANGNVNLDAFFNNVVDNWDEYNQKFTALTGRPMNASDQAALLRGEPVRAIVKPTMAAQRQTADIEAQRATTALEQTRLAQQNQQFLTQVTGKVNAGLAVSALDFGVATTGTFDAKDQITEVGLEKYYQLVDALNVAGLTADDRQLRAMLKGTPVNLGGPGTTLEARGRGADVVLKQQQLDLQRQQQDNQKKISEAELTGNLDEVQTLQAKQQEIDRTLRQVDQQVANQQFLTQVTGAIAGGGKINAAMFGIDTTGAFDSQNRLTAKGTEQLALLGDALDAAGVQLDQRNLQADMLSLMRGQPVQPQRGGQTLAAQAQGANVTLQQRQLSLQQQQQDTNAAIERARTFGQGKDPESGDTIQTLEAKKQTLDTELRRTELAMSGQQFLTTQTGMVGGGGTVTAAQLGVDISGLKNPDGTDNLDRRAQVQDQIAAALDAAGIPYDAGKVQTLMQNGSIQSGGAGTLAARELGIKASAQVVAQQLEREELGVKVGELLGTYGNKDTLAKTQQDLVAEIQRGELSLDTKQEWSRQREEMLRLTGQFQADVSVSMLLPEAMNAAGQLDMDKFLANVDKFEENFKAYAGREVTPEELAALARNQKVTVATAQTIEAKRLGNETAIARAEQSGLLWDPETGQNLSTLRKQQLEFDKEFSDKQQAWKQTMDLAEQAGFVTIGTNGTLKAEDLGVDVQYVRQLSNEDALGSSEAKRLQQAYQTMTGQQLSQQQLTSLLRNGTASVGREIRVETTTARAQREQAALNWSELAGQIGMDKTEAARQFDASLADRGNLTTAQVAQINAGIRQADDELEQNLIKYSAEKQIAWAELLGENYTNGTINAQSLGIRDIPSPTASQDEKLAALETISEAYRAMTGKDLSPGDGRKLMEGYSVTVSGSPTLAAKNLAAQVSTQGLERQADLHKFSSQFGLDERKFTEAQEEADRQYTMTSGQIANTYGLDQQKFLLAKMELEATTMGRVGIDGMLSAEDLGVVIPQNPTVEQQLAAVDDVFNTFTALQGRNPSESEVRTLLQRGSVSVQAQSTLSARQWAAQQAEVARRYGLDERTFTAANDQFDKQFRVNERNSWLQLNGWADIDPTTGGLRYSRQPWTTDYAKYRDAKTAFDKTEVRRDTVWANMLSSVRTESAGTTSISSLQAVGLLPRTGTITAQMIADAVEKEYGVRPTAQGVAYMQAGQQVGVSRADWSDANIAELSNFINGHSMAIAEANQGSGWAGLAGAVVGGTVGALVGGVGTGVGEAVGARIGNWGAQQ